MIHETVHKQGNVSLITGVLVLVVLAGLCKLLWMYIHAPFVWVLIVAWIVVPAIPFALRLISLHRNDSKQIDGMA